MDKQDKTAEDFFKLKCDEQWGKRQGVFSDSGTLPQVPYVVRPAIYSLMESYAQHRTAELEAKIKELELDLAHEIRVANGQTEINKELSQDLSDCSKELRAEIHVNDALLKQIKALEERLEAADEVIEEGDSPQEWDSDDYWKALEKYQSIKLKK